MRLLLLSFAVSVGLAAPVKAQNSGGFIVDFLEDSLSGDNRYVTVTGLEGALSSRATLERLTVADDKGVWLTVSGAVLDWNRSDLLRGNLVINALTAESITVSRPPGTTTAEADLPKPEAQPFALPELPVGISIAKLSVGQLTLGKPLLGIAAQLSADGRLSLVDGALDTQLSVLRLDRPSDRIDLTAAYANETRQIGLDLAVTEAEGGLMSEMLEIPDRPSVNLTAKGDGPVGDFTADIRLATNGMDRLGGTVQLLDAGEVGGIAFAADIGGDLTPILAQSYREFFGNDARLTLDGRKGADGSLTVSSFSLSASAMDLDGSLAVGGDGRLRKADIAGTIRAPEGEVVILPFGEPAVQVGRAVVDGGFDLDEGNGWRLKADVDRLMRSGFTVDRAEIDASGTFEQAADTRLDGQLRASLEGLALDDPDLQKAAGQSVMLDGRFGWAGGNALSLDEMVLSGTDYSARLSGQIDGLASGFAIEGQATLEARDLARFSGLAGSELAGSASARIAGSGVPLGGAFDLKLDAQAQDLKTGIAGADPMTAGAVTLAFDIRRDETGTRVPAFRLEANSFTATATGEITSAGTAGISVDGRAEVDARDLSVFSGLAGIDLGGRARATLNGNGAPLGGMIDITLHAQADNLTTGIAQVDPLIDGTTTLSLDARYGADGVTIRAFTLDGSALSADARGVLKPGEADLAFRAALDDLARVVPAVPGPVTLAGDLVQQGTAVMGELRLAGPHSSFAVAEGRMEASGALDATYRVQAGGIERFVPQLPGMIVAEGTVSRSIDSAWQVAAKTGGSVGLTGNFRARFSEATGIADIGFDAALERLERLIPQIRGTLTARGLASRSASATWQASMRTEGSAGIRGDFGATYDEATGDAGLTFDALLERLERLVPDIRGSLGAKGFAERSRDGHWQGEADAGGTAGISGRFDGSFEESTGDAAMAFDAAVARIERIVPKFPGTLSARGNAARTGSQWTIDTDARGPGGIEAALAGTYDQAKNQADVTAKGQAQLGLANAFIRPNTVAGLARFDLALRGSPGPAAISGTISTSGTTVALPSLAQTLNGIAADVRLSGGSARISMSGGVGAGGRFGVEGSAALAPPFNASADIALNSVVLTDNLSFTSSADGRLRFAGPLTGGGTLSGRVDFGETEINIAAASGAVGAAPIPEIVHVGEPAASYRTRERAGLTETGGNGGSAPIGLDITLSAPNRIFARGRGLDAELGGTVVVRGTTERVIPSGQISLIRGIFDILGRRLKLDEGQISLQGRLEPYVAFRATTATGDGQATLAITGPVDAPVIEVTSVPERPSDEALALLLFGDKFTELSPLKIAQLGAQLATLGGKGGGFLGNIRSGLGVDTLDVGADEDGNANLGVGAYVSERVYTDVNLNAKGETEINLNLDLTDSLTLKGSVDNTGDTGVGLFFEKDY